MPNAPTLGAVIQRFLVTYLMQERNVSPHTQQSYRDTLMLLLQFLAHETGITVDALCFEHVTAESVRRFLQYLEVSRHCSGKTRNQRLAAVHAFVRSVAEHLPERMVWCEQIRSIPFKKCVTPMMPYLEKSEMDALLALPNLTTAHGRREYALLLFLYNTGARVSEAVSVTIADLDLHYHPSVQLLGKGRKVRSCPLWAVTARTIKQLVAGRAEHEQVFLNRCGHPLTRFGMHTLVERYPTDAHLSVMRQKAYHAPYPAAYDGCSSVASRRRYQYHSRVARTRVAEYHQSLCGDRLGDESQSTGKMRYRGRNTCDGNMER